ncbi:nitroreductase family protein [Methanosarcina sp. MSH10X1]|uniref:nitroreductase family protein n=1 Tax=Methanosarcina sp. MSH10X1 TaxID=2507075 RepID=UPI000FFBF944|nr:nitroreductase family protein [Methanosarcina sp. MSH10X1]RXA21689.1 nitroreductase family protein [Methanosarcina sp. MSH10X1]
MLTNETLSTIKNRRSIRNFKNKQIKDEELQAVLNAGTYAPSANEQAWHFTVIQNKELLAWLNFEAKEIAKQYEPLQDLANNERFNIFYNAPTVILVSGEEKAIAIESDCAAATQNMLLAAESIGLGSCWIGFVLVMSGSPKAKEYLKKLGVPDGYKPYASVALGYKNAEVSIAPPRKLNVINYIK